MTCMSRSGYSLWRVLVPVLVLALGLVLAGSYALNADGALLLSLKYAILSDPLSALESWDYSDESPCSWNGITCAELGDPGTPDMFRVTALVLPNSQLLGSIPSDLGMIEHLRHLDLSNNFFNGSLPSSIFNLSTLEVLSLSNNVISGELPELVGGLASLQLLNLSDNALAGKVPENLTALRNLTVLSLRSNYFSGVVPSGFSSVQVLDLSSNLLNGSLPSDFGGESLRFLNLSYNKFSGEIPVEFAEKIPENATVDLSFNNLTGAIPESGALLNQRTEDFDGNLDLCGRPLKSLCSIPSTLSQPPNVSATTTTPAIAAIPKTMGSTSNETQNQEQSRLKPGTVAGIAVGDLAGIAFLGMIILYVYQQKTKKKGPIPNPSCAAKFQKSPGLTQDPDFKKQAAWSCLTTTGGVETSEATTSDSDPDDQNTAVVAQQGNRRKKGGSLVAVDGETKLEAETLLKASAYILGSSGGSIVYKAVLDDRTTLAVRRIGDNGIEKMKDFENQVRAIAKLRHPNVVCVRGFYWGDDEKLLISDYVPNGSLASAGGHRRAGTSPLNLPLEVRLRIARGVARGLAYIHERKQVHGNIKPSNILLTPDMEAVISDLGLDRLVSGNNGRSKASISSGRHFGSQRSLSSRDGATAQDVLTAGGSPFPAAASSTAASVSPYLAPESLKNLKPSPKWDVFSFGVVLLELLTGRVFSETEVGQWAGEEGSRVLRLADAAIRADVDAREDAVLACLRLGFGCACPVPQKRPSMKEALQVLENIPCPSGG